MCHDNISLKTHFLCQSIQFYLSPLDGIKWTPMMFSDMVTGILEKPSLRTILAQHGHTDARVAQLDERGAAL